LQKKKQIINDTKKAHYRGLFYSSIFLLSLSFPDIPIAIARIRFIFWVCPKKILFKRVFLLIGTGKVFISISPLKDLLKSIILALKNSGRYSCFWFLINFWSMR